MVILVGFRRGGGVRVAPPKTRGKTIKEIKAAVDAYHVHEPISPSGQSQLRKALCTQGFEVTYIGRSTAGC